MKDEFIPYEQALVLKELGFDEPNYFLKWYDSKGDIREGLGLGEVIAPLYQQAFRWFREKYNLSYSIDWMTRNKDYYNGYFVHFRGINGHKLNEDNFVVLNDELPPEGYGVYKTYEEAELACLIKLIKICKEFIHQ
jgi:hypothetical protein